jgi:beta-lactam-binding protein with PASTA domain/tRNA A-37 threonylcarbamoyl transferase component Bud32
LSGIAHLDWATVDTTATVGATTVDALVGRLLDGRYRLESTIARGGMATVYLATDTRLDRVVAVKVMRAALADDPEFVERFTREARAAARLSSPDVVAVFDQGTDAASGVAYLVMEHVPGCTLRDLLRARGPFTPTSALGLLEPVLRALSAAHAAGLVHRDIKPENVLVADDGRVKVADFGLARAVETNTLTGTTGLLLGTVAYLAPEQVVHGRADARTDVYAAGILVWELLTGTPPYQSDSPLSVAYRHVNEDVPPPSTVVEAVPAAVDELVVRATRRDPAARPVDAGAFLAEVRAALVDLPDDDTDTVIVRRPTDTAPTIVVETGAPPRPSRRRRRPRKGVVWALVVALLGAAALVGGWYLGSGRFTDVPAVLGVTEAQARTQLTAADLEVLVDPEGRYDETVPAGLVLDQDPDPGSRVERGEAVTLTLSLGPDRRPVPELAGKDVPTATAELEEAGLRPGPVTEEFSDAPVGQVLRTDPPAGEPLPPESTVALVVSKGLEMLAVPDVVGKSQRDAGAILQDAGFRSAVREVFSETVAKGTVVAQEPSSGRAPRGATVALQVSKGPELVTVPDVGGKSREEAEAILTGLGLKVDINARPGPGGVVRFQDPGSGAQVRKGTTVTLFVF